MGAPYTEHSVGMILSWIPVQAAAVSTPVAAAHVRTSNGIAEGWHSQRP